MTVVFSDNSHFLCTVNISFAQPLLRHVEDEIVDILACFIGDVTNSQQYSAWFAFHLFVHIMLFNFLFMELIWTQAINGSWTCHGNVRA